ncbi:MAG: cache domain-containing protein [Treponema sp.]
MAEGIAELGTVFNRLLSDYGMLRNSLKEIENQSQNIRILSFNSSIEAARAGNAGKGFHIISQEIRKISENNKAVNDACNSVVDEIEKQMNDLIGIRTADVAFDTIDKIDRNLFERYCDVQAWATFGKIIEACKNPDAENCRRAQATLSHLVKIYEVYYDIILTDVSGKVITCGVRDNLAGTDFSDKDWFAEVMRTGAPFYTDMYFSKTIDNYVMTYSSPVLDSDYNIVGVISTRFNWKFVLDIIDRAKIAKTSSIRLVNNDGIVIGSAKRDEILKMNVRTSDAFTEIKNGTKYGFCFSRQTAMTKAITGFAKTSGYNAYPGKEWSVIIEENY